MNTKLFLLFGTSLSLIPTLTFAQCVATQDCATLGYTENSCSGGNGVKCPFGNKWACFKSESEIKNQLCTDLGFTQTCTGGQIGVGKACNGKYSECKCNDGYIWNDSSQKCEDATANCVVGALYYSDGTCSNDYISSKKLLGIVIYEKTASQSGWVMTHKPVATAIQWGVYGTTTGITDKAASASCTNTQKLVALGSSYDAAIAANNYKEGGKTWCLPSYDVLNNLNNQNNFTKFNAAILEIQSKAGTSAATILGNVSGGHERVWSSSESSGSYAWTFYADTAGSFHMGNSNKGEYSYRSVRPVLAFQVFIKAGARCEHRAFSAPEQPTARLGVKLAQLAAKLGGQASTACSLQSSPYHDEPFKTWNPRV